MSIAFALTFAAMFLPFIASLFGSNGIWQFLALLFGCLCFAAVIASAGPFPAFIAWIIGWIFAAAAINSKRNDRRFSNLERSIRGNPRQGIDDEALLKNVRRGRQEPRF